VVAGETGHASDEWLSTVCHNPTPIPLVLTQDGEEAAWRASLGPAAAAVAAAGTPYSRLASEADVAPLVAQAQQLLQPKKDPDEGALGLGWCETPQGCVFKATVGVAP